MNYASWSLWRHAKTRIIMFSKIHQFNWSIKSQLPMGGGGTICLLQDSAEILESRNLFCEYFCNWQSCPSKGWLCRESSETVLKKVEIGKNLRKHFLENISYRLFQTFSLILLALIAAMENKKPLKVWTKNHGLVTHSDWYTFIYFFQTWVDHPPSASFWICLNFFGGSAFYEIISQNNLLFFTNDGFP